MWRHTVVVSSVAAVLLGAAWIGQALSEEGGVNAPRPRGPEQFRQQMADRMKEALGVKDEEWKVLEPRIEKVQTLALQSWGGMGFMGRRGPRPGEAADRTPTEIEKRGEGLQKLLENKEAKPEEIKTALAALREARAKARADLETARKELREVLTVRQEAQMVLMGLLE